MFSKVLIANRGEIAIRITQTLQEMGIVAISVYSDADKRSMHVMQSDEAVHLEGTSPGETYLNIPKLIEAAKEHGADAIHPGYGFLSENAEFARACAKAGIVFIGPTPEVIDAMGDKIIAKKTLGDAGVPVIPGVAGKGDESPEQIQAAAEKVGYPVLLKAAAGGGGKGMRVVREPEQLVDSLAAAQREARNAFGDDRMFVEKYIDRPRHIEFQIFGDTHGNVVHLFERECSIQRRHQKIVEESPSVALTPELRAAMAEAAVKTAKAIGYTNAGTVEFILAESGEFYFLEVNTRLQVEHPVTEMIVGHDLVRAQLLVAAGEPLPFTQEELTQTGHAIECRVYAEDPSSNFLPSVGEIEVYVPPSGANVRVDGSVRQWSEVSVHYDPMLSKLIVWGRDRTEALERMSWALQRYVVLGVTTNIEFLQNVIADPEFIAGRIHTHFLEERAIAPTLAENHLDAAFMVAGLILRGGEESVSGGGADHDKSKHQGPWENNRSWRNV